MEYYLRELTKDQRKAVLKIIANAGSNEERWVRIKTFFSRTSPWLVDNFFAWNLYRTTL